MKSLSHELMMRRLLHKHIFLGEYQLRSHVEVPERVKFLPRVLAVLMLPPLAYSITIGEVFPLFCMTFVYVFGGLIGLDKFIKSSGNFSQTLTTGCVPPSGTRVIKFKMAA